MIVTKKYPAELYAEQVRSGEILVCEYVRLAVERYCADFDCALDKGRYFDKKAALCAICFIEKLKHTKGEWAGTAVPTGTVATVRPVEYLRLDGLCKARAEANKFGLCRPLPKLAFGKNADGTRRFRYAYIEIARKNGKTALSAGVGLYMLFADGKSRPWAFQMGQ